MVGLNDGQLGAEGGAEAYAGAAVEATADAGVDGRYGGAGAGAGVSAGVSAGAELGGGASVGADGVVGAEIDIGARLLVGAEISLSVEVDTFAIAKDVYSASIDAKPIEGTLQKASKYTTSKEAKFVRKRASSTAVFPPPVITISWFLKKKPSQVAHAETPNPLYLSSDSKPNHFACAPVARIMDSARNSFPDSHLATNG